MAAALQVLHLPAAKQLVLDLAAFLTETPAIP